MLAALLALALVAPQDVARSLRAGVATVDVTPTPPIRLAGYASRTTESTAVEQHLFAKALAIAQGDEAPVVIVTLDSTGITAAIRSRVLDAVRDSGLDPARIALCVTHSHNAPMLTGTIPNMFGVQLPDEQQARIDAHTAVVIAGIARSIHAALADLRPALIDHARGRATFARNRRTAGGPADHDLPLLRVRATDGSLRALLAMYACHCTTLGGGSNLVCGDWAGYAQEYVEEAHASCTSMIAIGCGADANPEPRGDLALAQQHGRAIATEVDRLLDGPFAPIEGPIGARFETVDLAFAPPPTRTELLARVSQGGGVGYHARVQLARLDRGEDLRTSIPLPVQAFVFGDELAMVFLGGEVVVDYSLRLRHDFDRTRLWVLGYSNDISAYIPSERILREGGYEGGGAMIWYDQPTAFEPGLEQQIIERVHAQLPESLRAYGGSDSSRTEGIPPRSPRRALASLRARDGLRIELAACEPQIESPVAIDFAPDGSVLVCEMRDYPTVGGPKGRVTRLRDRDGDGHYETAERFLNDVTLPTGILAWGDGAIVCAAPEVIFARDTDGDGMADERTVMLVGFADHNEQALVNSPGLGLDGAVWFACGLFGGSITSPRSGQALDLRGRDFRFEPETGDLAPASGRTQQGRPRGDFDDWFGCDNGTLAWHYPLRARDLERNPHFAARNVQGRVAVGEDPDRMFQISAPIARFNDAQTAGRTTSACGIAVMRDAILGADTAGDLFVCEPVAGVVRRLHLEADGATFHGDRAPGEETREFLASTDPWFRPVQVRTGPDGALWVVDMARFLIEHPRWVPEARLAAIDPRAGDRFGRIWRIVPGSGATRPMPSQEGAGAVELARALMSPNGTVRDLAQMQLRGRPSVEVVAAVRGLDLSAAPAASRAQVSSILASGGALERSDLLALLSDRDARVRRHGVMLARPWLVKDEVVAKTVLGLEHDSDATVRFELALALGDWPHETASAALARLLIATSRDDTLLLDAIFSSALPHLGALVHAAARIEEPRRSDLLDVLLPMVVATGARDVASSVVVAMSQGSDPPTSLRIAGLLAPLLRGDESLSSAIAVARLTIGDPAADLETRVAAASLLGVDGDPADTGALVALLAPDSPAPLQQAAIRALGGARDGIATPLLERWSTASPALRDALFDLLVRRADGALAVLDRAARDAAFASSLSAGRRQVLRNHSDAAVRQRAGRAFDIASKRGEVVAAYRDVDTERGDPQRGREVFTRACSVCHLLEGIGRPIGPDLAALSDRSTPFLLESILDPNKAVRDDYAMYAISRRDGSAFFGRIAADDGNHITIVGVDAVQHVLARADIGSQVNTGVSLMPDGLEVQIDSAGMADLIAFLRQERRVRREFAGNTPVVVTPDVDGALELLATNCEIYGESVVLESEFHNLGYWHAPSDQAVWTVELPSAGHFTVDLDYACAGDAAGNNFVLDGGTPVLRGTIATTGGWSRYATTRIGELDLAAGRSRITLRPDGNLNGGLMDLRAVRLRQ